MNNFFPPNIEQKPLPTSKTERIFSQVFGAAVALAVALQMIGAVQLNVVRDALAQYGFGGVGHVLDIGFELFHSVLSGPVPQVASWTEMLPAATMHNGYLAVLTLAIGFFATSFSLAIHREQTNFARGMGDTRSW
ncbi:hypothetical protein [Paraburkholderia fungorum]|uniref:hypothetical protein n=1 Tax=Paraburkholderia fungorum TaxID=134537 RepID=UPI001607A81E|nr:hypothetical protein [Paraburkholderia fungorum]MBB5547382.1 hypothetical protein [Paraburkholderia fungorum]